VIDLETKASTTYDGPKSSATPTPAPAPTPAVKEEPKPVPVKQTSVTEMTGKLPNMQDLEIKQDDPDSDEEITEAKKRAPSTGGFDDDDEVVEAKPVEKTVEETKPWPSPEPKAVKDEPDSKEVKEEAAPAVESPSTPTQDSQSNAEVRIIVCTPPIHADSFSIAARSRKTAIG
jgi:hypothetical protein